MGPAESCGPTVYRIRVRGGVDETWSDWFGGLDVSPQENGETLLTGPVPDQAALHGLLERIRDLNLVLLSVTRPESTEDSEQLL